MKKIFFAIICFLCITLSSCTPKTGLYFYFDDIVKYAYADKEVQIVFHPYQEKNICIYAHNNTDKILFVDKGTSFLTTNNQTVENMYHASSNMKGTNYSTSTIVGRVATTEGAFNGNMISEKRVIPVAPHSTAPIYIANYLSSLINQGIIWGNGHCYYEIDGKGKIKKIKKGTQHIYNEQNTILKYEATIRYSFTEDFADYKDATMCNFLKAWVADNPSGVYNYETANLPFANIFRADTDNYFLIGSFVNP